MIHGFKDKCMTTSEEWLIDYSLKTGNLIDINTDLLDTPITFNGKEINAFIIGVLSNRLVIQLALPMVTKFDDKSNRYETSYVRELINSNKFLNRFNPEFVKHIQLAEVYTEDYVTNDKLWLLSHEEINSKVNFLKTNDNRISFEMFKTINLKTYSQMMIKNEIGAYGWRLRSAHLDTNYEGHSRIVGSVDSNGYVNCDYANYTTYGALFPACIIG